jgi:hypothetical protein
LRLSNPTDQTIYCAVFERRWAEAGLFYFPGAREARVYYWLLVGAKGGYRVADLRTMVVPF